MQKNENKLKMVGNIESKQLEMMIDNASRVVVISHFNPDGDAVGSSTGCFQYLKNRGKDVRVILPSKLSDNFQFLNPKDEPILIFSENPDLCNDLINNADLIICLDFNSLRRTEYLSDQISSSKAKKVLIDHHLNPDIASFDLVISEIQISSASELLFWTLMELSDIRGDVHNLPLSSATSLYTGMMTDTNNFNNSVFPSTFEMASKLIERGVEKNIIQETVLNSYSNDRMRLMGFALMYKMRYYPELGAAIITLNQSEKVRFNFQTGDTEGFVNLPLSIKDVIVSAFFSESYTDEKSFVKVSLRSKGDFDVNQFAMKYFNGGGHKNASGGRLYMPMRKVAAYFVKSLKAYRKSLSDGTIIVK